MYINRKIFDWDSRAETSTVYNSGWNQPYEGWRHAEEIISKYDSKFHLIDVISTLKRCVDYRVKDLNKKYHLKHINSSLKKMNGYERLAHFGIIKSIMLKQLLEIRNNVEHKNGDPPPKARCEELIEFVWYFLRSTDSYCHFVVNDLILEQDDDSDSEYWINIAPSFETNWDIELSGWLTQEYCSSSPKDGFIKINVSDKETFEEFKIRMGDDIDNYHKGRNDTDVYIRSASIDNVEIKEHLIEVYFKSNST